MVQELRGIAQGMQATDRKFAHFCRAGVKVAEWREKISTVKLPFFEEQTGSSFSAAEDS